jgi:hypothetical protein
MSSTVQELIGQLAEPAKRAQARLALQGQGASVLDDLLAALERPAAPDVYKSVLRLLLELADPRSLDAFRKGLLSEDEEIRAISAEGLYRLGAPDALGAALATIDDAPDLLHADVTPSIRTLTAFGLTAVPSILPLLEADGPRTRQHAQKALEQITYNLVTRQTDSHLSQPLEDWQKLWEENGNYHWDASPSQRAEAIDRWQNWLENLSGQHRNPD